MKEAIKGERMNGKMKSKKKGKLKKFSIVLFCVLVSILCHIRFMGANGYIFTFPGADATSQMLVFSSFLEENWSKGNFFWSWEYGLGGDIFTELTYYYTTSIFFIVRFLIKLLLAVDFKDLMLALQWKIILSVIKQSLAMGFMYLYLGYNDVKIKSVFRLIGALIYGTGIWYLKFSLSFDYMTDAIVWLPLICLGIKQYKKENKKNVKI